MAIIQKIAMQFKKPTGVFGNFISNLMIIGNRYAYDTILEGLALKSKDKILEIGYGPGIGIELLSKKTEMCDIYGIDFSELMYRKASKRNRHNIKNNRVHLLFGDFVDTEISAGLFDKIFCLNVIYFWSNIQRPFSKVFSLLTEGGIFCIYMEKSDNLDKTIITRNNIFNRYSVEEVSEALKSSGFTEVDYFYRRGYFITAKK